MTNQIIAPEQRSRRGQKYRRGQKQQQSCPSEPSISTPPKRPAANSQAEAINQHIHRLDLAKRKIRLFNKVALFIAVVCVGNNIFNILSNRRSSGRGGASFLGEAFQSIGEKYGYGKKQQRSNNQQWQWSLSLFGKLGNNFNSRNAVPKETLQPFGSYPNILNITNEMRDDFHPVIKIPLRKEKRYSEDASCTTQAQSRKRSIIWPWQKQRNRNNNNNNNHHSPEKNNDPSCIISLEQRKLMNETYDYIVKDYTGTGNDNNQNNDIDNADTNTVLLQGGKRVPQLLPTREEAIEYAKLPNNKKAKLYDVGRYDEDRRGMYTSSLFVEDDTTSTNRRRTVHVGIDIGAPVMTPVYAFTDGIIHSAGYNSEVGDYGHVIVIEHNILNNHHNVVVVDDDDDDEVVVTKVYALYGHLAAKSIQGKHPGQKIKKGQVIGYLGNTAENGGWTGTHIHFQLAVNPPPTHDMPGVVALDQREEALLEYLDPRYVLGELY